jgi:serine/threonine protein kinase
VDRLTFADTDKLVPLAVADTPLIQSPKGNRIYETRQAESGDISPFLYKEYQDKPGSSGYLRRLKQFHDYLNHHSGVRTHVAAVPLTVVTRPDPTSYGVLIRRVAGVPLQSFSQLPTLLLQARLELALDLASAAVVLHGHGIIHTDLTSANIMCDDGESDSPQVNIIDLDLAAVQQQDGWYPTLPPVVGPGLDSPYWAPEQDGGQGVGPSIWTDRWCLAVALHHLLLTPYYLSILQEPLSLLEYSPPSEDYTGPHQWPSPKQPGERPEVTRHREQLDMLGPLLKQYFIDTFDQRNGVQPKSRKSASDWLKALVMARAFAFVCPGEHCTVQKDYGFVSFDNRCPVCGRPGMTPGTRARERYSESAGRI